jgi:D-alanyl-D-alanine carboxypeptidase (penicillin-binding protein 5/6)
MVNTRAIELGAKNTHFVTPNGLYAPGHCTTAYDLAVITRYALQIPEFNEIVRMKRWTLTRSINTKDLLVVNKSPFIKKYPGADGVKSGYIKQAGYCYVGSATRNGWRLISVVLRSNNSSKDSMTLMDYGFSNFKRTVVAPKGKTFRSSALPSAGTLIGTAADTLYVDVPNQLSGARFDAKAKFAKVDLPVKKGQVIGDVTAYMNDVPVGAVLLRSCSNVDKSIAAGSTWFWMKTGMIVLVCTGMVLKYGGAAAKNPRRSRRRIETEGRGTYRLR